MTPDEFVAGLPALCGPRYVRFRCPTCYEASSVCDQATDIQRLAIGSWWREHLTTHTDGPIIEAVPNEKAEAIVKAESEGWT